MSGTTFSTARAKKHIAITFECRRRKSPRYITEDSLVFVSRLRLVDCEVQRELMAKERLTISRQARVIQNGTANEITIIATVKGNEKKERDGS